MVSTESAIASEYRKSRAACISSSSPAMMNENSPICARLIPAWSESFDPAPRQHRAEADAEDLPRHQRRHQHRQRHPMLRHQRRIEHHPHRDEEYRREHIAHRRDQILDLVALIRFRHQRSRQERAQRHRIADVLGDNREPETDADAGDQQGLRASRTGRRTESRAAPPRTRSRPAARGTTRACRP